MTIKELGWTFSIHFVTHLRHHQLFPLTDKGSLYKCGYYQPKFDIGLVIFFKRGKNSARVAMVSM